jgi:uncharacterized protein (UPF0335 family)
MQTDNNLNEIEERNPNNPTDDFIPKTVKIAGISAEQLRSIIERVEKLEEDKAGLTADIRDIYTEAKGNGFNVPTIRKIVRLRKKAVAERQEEEYLESLYRRALGLDPEIVAQS